MVKIYLPFFLLLKILSVFQKNILTPFQNLLPFTHPQNPTSLPVDNYSKIMMPLFKRYLIYCQKLWITYLFLVKPFLKVALMNLLYCLSVKAKMLSHFPNTHKLTKFNNIVCHPSGNPHIRVHKSQIFPYLTATATEL